MAKDSKTGVETTFKDKDGKAIRIHDYVIDAAGNRYYINSHCQAVPEEGDAPAVELARLLETSEVAVMSPAEVLSGTKKPIERRRGRKPSTQQQPQAAAHAAPEADAPGAHEGLSPVTEEMLLHIIPDNVLANELRRRGYTLCAVRPALIEL